MATKTMFAGGSWADNAFHIIARHQLVTATSSLNALSQFANNLGFQYTSDQELLQDIHSQDAYSEVPNFDIYFIQSEILKAFDTNSSFYFHLYEEGDCHFISFADEIKAYN